MFGLLNYSDTFTVINNPQEKSQVKINQKKGGNREGSMIIKQLQNKIFGEKNNNDDDDTSLVIIYVAHLE